MSFREYVEMTDPAVIRALAHPARMRMLAFLEDGPATATECSEIVGQSPSACSYHLRTLAGLGFVDEVDSSDGRTRRWSLKVRGHGIPKRVQNTPEMQAAARVWGGQWAAFEHELRAEYFDREAGESSEWRRAATFANDEVHLTPDELIAVGEQMMALLEPFRERSEAGRVPEGARRVHVSLTAFPRPETRR